MSTGTHWIEGSCYIIQFFKCIDKQAIQDHIAAVKELSGSKMHPFLLDFSESEYGVSFEALKVWSTNQNMTQLRIAEAYVVRSLADRISVRQHIRLNLPPYEVNVFNEMEDAKNWLAEFNNNQKEKNMKIEGNKEGSDL